MVLYYNIEILHIFELANKAQIKNEAILIKD
jgi:hypothetical protein